MAIYHLSVKIGRRSKGVSSVGAAAYRAGEQLTDDRTGRTYDYRGKDVTSRFIMSPHDLVLDRSALWNQVEQSEKRGDAQVYRELEIALPKELGLEENTRLLREFIANNVVSRNVVADVAIHKAYSDNPHAHVLTTLRPMKEDGTFGNKDRDLNKKEYLMRLRKDWADTVNRELAKTDPNNQISEKSLEAQGINRIPTKHLGPDVAKMEARGIRTTKGDRAAVILAENAQLEKLERIENASNRSNSEEPKRRPASPAPQPARRIESAVEQSRIEPKPTPTTKPESARPPSQNREDNRPNRNLGDSGVGIKRGERGSHVPAAAARKVDDLTERAVDRHLRALNIGSSQFEVGIFLKEGTMMVRKWSSNDIKNNIAFLQAHNANGAAIYIRPVAEGNNTGYVLLDDISKDKLSDLNLDGLKPAAVVQTSPGNYQAWIKISHKPLGNKLTTAICKGLSNRYGADLKSADWRHFGRLAGFTNSKPKYRTAKGQPFVTIHDWSGLKAPAADKIVSDFRHDVLEESALQKPIEDADDCYTPTPF